MSLASLLELIGPPLRRTILKFYGADSCIASTRVAIDVLEGLGLNARPLMVETEVFNAAMIRLIEADAIPDDPAERIRKFDETGAWGLALGKPDPRRTDVPKELMGIHVVAIVQERLLWDLSIDQASRPQRNMSLEGPLVFATTPAFLAGREPLVVAESKGMGMIRIKPKPADTRYTVSPNWQPDGHDAPKRREIVGAALAWLRKPEWQARMAETISAKGALNS